MSRSSRAKIDRVAPDSPRGRRPQGRRSRITILGALIVIAAIYVSTTGLLRSAERPADIHLGPLGGPGMHGAIPSPEELLAMMRDAWPPSVPLTVDEITARAGHLISPIAGAHPSTRYTHWPGAARAYRNGTHFGLDYYSGYTGVTVTDRTQVVAVADGWVIRADHGFRELTTAQRALALERARLGGDDDPAAVDPLHGRQVWVLHSGGLMTRYSHLSAVDASLNVGDRIEAGAILGLVGNSGTNAGATSAGYDYHLHFELYIDWSPAWAMMAQDDVVASLRAILAPR